MNETMQISVFLVAVAMSLWILLAALLPWRRERNNNELRHLEFRAEVEAEHARAIMLRQHQEEQLALDKAEHEAYLEGKRALFSYGAPLLAEMAARAIAAIWPNEVPVEVARERPTVPEDGKETAE